MDVTSGWLDYGTLGLLALVLVGVAWMAKMVIPRWLNQVEAAIRTQEASATAMAAMASAMTALAASVVLHDKDSRVMQQAILDAICKKRVAPKPRVKAP